MNYMNGLATSAVQGSAMNAPQQVLGPPHSQRINVLEDSLNTAHERISQLEKMLQELYAKVG